MSLNIGIYNLNLSTRGGGEKRTLVLAEHWSRSYRVRLLVGEAPDVPALERYFGVDLSRVEVVVLGDLRKQQGTSRFQQSVLAADLDHFRRIRALGLDVFVNNSFYSTLPSPAPRGLYVCMFPHRLVPEPVAARPLRRLAYRALWTGGWWTVGRRPRILDSYQAIASNSAFTTHWIETWWKRTPTTLYSVCDGVGRGGAKEKVIVHVGRFQPHKRQDVLLQAFARASSLHRAGWHLHFVGSTAPEDAAFLADLRREARGLPVTFHPDADLHTLRALYQSAAIYWHATGYGFDPETHPSAQEHFGVTTVEAMSAGAVPVVINSGGQRETVTHQHDGLLWDDLEQLLAYTQQLADDAPLRRRLSDAAVQSSARFSRDAFNARYDALLAQLMSAQRV